MLIYGRYHLQLDRDRRWQRTDLNGRTAWLIVRKILGINAIIRRKIGLHICQKNSYIDDLVPRRTCILNNVPHILEHRSALRFDVVRNDLATVIEFDARDLFRSAFARADAGKEQQIADTACVRIKPDGLRCFGRIERLIVHERNKLKFIRNICKGNRARVNLTAQVRAKLIPLDIFNVIIRNEEFYMSLLTKFALGTLAIVAAGCGVASSGKTADLPNIPPVVESQPMTESPKNTETAVFAGGCFWGIEGVFEHVKGVIDVKSGYAGGDAKTADYEKVSSGDTDHAESVQVVFDPAKVTYAQLLKIFFSVAHDPTELDRQGPDTGRQYRSAIFYASEEQKSVAQAYIEELDKAKTYPKPIVTEVSPLKKFYAAEAYHQDFMKKNPTHGYIVVNDKPKVEELKKRFPESYVEK